MTHLPDLLGFLSAGLVIGILAVVLIDGGYALLGFGEFGRFSGWLVVVGPAWLFVEEFRAWWSAPTPAAVPVLTALAGAPSAVALGLLIATGTEAATGAPPLLNGTIGALASSVGYAVLWYSGVRRLDRLLGG